MISHEVVISGAGIVSALGIGREKFDANLFAGSSGIVEIPSQVLDTTHLRSHTAGYISDLRSEDFLPSQKAYLDRCSTLTLIACALAIDDARLRVTEDIAPRIGICLGTAYACQDSMLIFWERILKGGFRYASSIMFTHAYMNTPISLAAIEFSLKGYHSTYSAGLVSGGQAIAHAILALKRKLADCILAGGVEAFSPLTFMANYQAGKLTPCDDGDELMRPFDAHRNGWVLGDGAAILVLETDESARARGAQILGRVMGIGMTQPFDESTDALTEAIERSMRQALMRSEVAPRDLGWICATANGDLVLDEAEALAIARLLGDDSTVPVSSIKAATGECVGAGGALNAYAAVASLQYNRVPPTLNVNEPCENINVVIGRAVEWDARRPVLVNIIDPQKACMSMLIAPP